LETTRVGITQRDELRFQLGIEGSSPVEPSRDIPTVPCGCIQGCINCAYTGRKAARPAKEPTAMEARHDKFMADIGYAPENGNGNDNNA
jgi:hypothetical protein